MIRIYLVKLESSIRFVFFDVTIDPLFEPNVTLNYTPIL